MSFIRTKEDFVCAHCDARVTGSGYTNHCPQCLWSTHIDEDPGDRASPCAGAMEPTNVFVSGTTFRIRHTCRKCGLIRVQDSSPEDNQMRLVELSAYPFNTRD